MIGPRLSLLVLSLTLLATPVMAQPETEPHFADVNSQEEPGRIRRARDKAAELLDFERLQRYAKKLRLSHVEEELTHHIVTSLADRVEYRRKIADLLNRNGGRLDRAVNKVLIRKAWKKHGPLPNLTPVTDSLLRGGQPSEAGFRKLKEEHSVGTIVNLRLEERSEKAPVEALGMTYVELLIPDTEAPSQYQAIEFLRLAGAATPENKLFFHCAAGSFRTGTMAALYRMVQGMSLEDALEEARSLGYIDNWLNSDQEAAFLRDWAKTLDEKPAATRGTRSEIDGH